MRGKHSGVTSDAMSGPYGTATGAITLEDTTETTRVTQHRGNKKAKDPNHPGKFYAPYLAQECDEE